MTINSKYFIVVTFSLLLTLLFSNVAVSAPPPPGCGNGVLSTFGEQCDDCNNINGDGCSSSCKLESGYTCAQGPSSTCSSSQTISICSLPSGGECGDGTVNSGEACDDGGNTAGNGCSASCTVESGWSCSGSPSTCTQNPVCGNTQVESGEQCDDGNSVTTDSCISCTSARCGDGFVRNGAEQCDDANQVDTDACRNTCVAATCTDGIQNNGETGIDCGGSCAACAPTQTCNNNVKEGTEACDNGGGSGDGCSATCTLESGWSCTGATGSASICALLCGNGVLDGAEQCDDDFNTNGDGCSSVCTIESGWTCANEPSSCSPVSGQTCGNSIVEGTEMCDNGLTSGDGCSAMCVLESGWTCTRPLGSISACSRVTRTSRLPLPPPIPGVENPTTGGSGDSGTGGSGSGGTTSGTSGSTSSGTSSGTTSSGGGRTTRNALQTNSQSQNKVQPQLDPVIATPVPQLPAPSVPRTAPVLPAVEPSAPASDEPVSFIVIISISVGVLILCVGGTYAVLHYSHTTQVPPQIVDYIADNIKKGYAAEELKQKLMTSGWPQKVVDAAMKQIQTVKADVNLQT